jgi:hypothetical protein
LTYAARCQVDGPICHVPDPGEPDNVWWFGFDCSHAVDRAPGIEAMERRHGLEDLDTGIWPGAVYRDLAYVQSEVERLAAQLTQRCG